MFPLSPRKRSLSLTFPRGAGSLVQCVTGAGTRAVEAFAEAARLWCEGDGFSKLVAAAFDAADRDGDGRVDLAEVFDALEGDAAADAAEAGARARVEAKLADDDAAAAELVESAADRAVSASPIEARFRDACRRFRAAFADAAARKGDGTSCGVALTTILAADAFGAVAAEGVDALLAPERVAASLDRMDAARAAAVAAAAASGLAPAASLAFKILTARP